MGFKLNWLRLREPLDAEARSAELKKSLLSWIGDKKITRACDLGAGTGSTMRFLPEIPRWRLVDVDDVLLDTVDDSQTVATEKLDLAKSMPSFEQDELITASAFLDLVSVNWLERFADAVTQVGATLYITMTVDGRIAFEPAHYLDNEIRAAFKHHQKVTDKGFGTPAAGEGATQLLSELLRERNYTVSIERSDWAFSNDSLIYQPYIHGLARASIDAGIERMDAKAWLSTRSAEDTVTVRVGHLDLFAHP